MFRYFFLLVLIFLVSLAAVSSAGIPKLINYQGMLTDNSGTPLNGSYSITFKIFNAESDGTKKWEETQSSVSVTNGLFNVILGSLTPIDLDFSEDYWLDITVGEEQMPSRLKFTSVGYAYRAQLADTANYARAAGGESVSPWIFRVTDGNDTTVITSSSRWGVARYGCTLYGNADSTHVNLGNFSVTGKSGQNYKYCTVGGGYFNYASGISAVVGGGNSNTASGEYATVGGGRINTADTTNTTVGGGYNNTASGYSTTVGGGYWNTASGNHATVGGGWQNTASAFVATVGGGYGNIASGERATVGGGDYNTASGRHATVAGGYNNTASGNYSFAAGCKAKANHLGTFVWADSSVNADFASTGSNQFLIRADGGVGIGTNSPDERLHVENSDGDNCIKIRSASACTSSIKLFEGSDYGFELAYAGNDDKLHLWSRKFSGNEDIRMTWQKDGKVGIGTTTPGTRLSVVGLTGTTSYSSVRVNTATGDFYYYSSSRRYKDDIQPLKDDFHKILTVEPKSFVDKASGQREVGYIAEEFDGMGLNNLVIYNQDGQPDGLKYELVSLYLLEVVKELKAKNEELQQRIEALERQ